MSATRTALITGASAGLGREFADLFAADGHAVVLVARRRERLEEVAAEVKEAYQVAAHVVPADLADPGAPQAIFDATQALGVEVDFLVNNAGFGSNGAFVDLDLARELAMIQVNVTALTALTGLFAPGMVARKRGRVLNVASTAGFQAGPYMATYYATKAYVVSFTEALAIELEGTGVTATCHCPGATATEFAGIAGNDTSKLFKAGGVASARAVAEHAYAAMHKGKALAIHGFKNKFGVQSLRFAPRRTVQRVAARLNRE